MFARTVQQTFVETEPRRRGTYREFMEANTSANLTKVPGVKTATSPAIYSHASEME